MVGFKAKPSEVKREIFFLLTNVLQICDDVRLVFERVG